MQIEPILYVGTNGSDSHAGTLSAPFATINAAVSHLSGGGTVEVLGGVYHQAVVVNGSGTASAPIDIMAAPGASVVLDGSTLHAHTDIVDIYGSNVVFQGFDVQGGNSHGIVAWDTTNVSIIDNMVHDNYSSGIYVGGDSLAASTNNSVTENTLYNNVLSNSARTASGGWAPALAINTSANAVVADNWIYNNYGEGIDVCCSSGAQVVNNTTHDNYSMNIYLDNALSATVKDNFSYSTGNPNYLMKGTQRSIGIGIADETHSTTTLSNNLIIEDNVVEGTRFGIYYGSYGYNCGLKNAFVVNNTVANTTDSAIHIDPSSKSSGNIFSDNIFSSPSSTLGLASGSASGSTFEHNCWYGGTVASGFSGVGDVIANPHFLAPTSGSAAGYEVSATSPCVGAGQLWTAVPVDYLGSARKVSNTIGAFQA